VVVGLVATATATPQGPQRALRHDKTKSGDFYLAKTGDSDLATSGDFFMATDNSPARISWLPTRKVATDRGRMKTASARCNGNRSSRCPTDGGTGSPQAGRPWPCLRAKRAD
jgi:hypothetical protein